MLLVLLPLFSIWQSLLAKAVPRKDNISCLRSPAKSTFKCLILDTLLWRGIMSTNLKNPKEQDNQENGALNTQPWLTCVTPTALLGSWGQQPLKDMTSLETDFEIQAYWQGYAEESIAQELVAWNTSTIASGKAWGTYWNKIKCKEHCGNPPEAVIRQATINLDLQVWKSLKDSLPKLYCADLAEAYDIQESTSLRLMCRKKEKSWYAIAQRMFAPETFGEERKWEKNPVLSLLLGSHECLAFRKQAQCVPESWGRTYNVLPGSAQGLRK